MAESGAVVDDQPVCRVIFLPGMAARGQMWDEVVRRLQPPVIKAEIWEWITPIRNETLAEYAARWAELNKNKDAGRTIVVGASFGGIIGQEVAKILEADALVLVGSVKSREELPLWIRTLSPFRQLVRLIPWRMVQWGVRKTRAIWRPIAGQDLALVIEEFVSADAKLIGWSIRRLLGWRADETVACEVFRIHGDQDRLLPLRKDIPSSIIAGAGHVLPVTHPAEVSDTIVQLLQIGADRNRVGT